MNILDQVLEKARFSNFSDVHIDEKGQVLTRLDGKLMPFPHMTFTAEQTKEMIRTLIEKEDTSSLERQEDLDFVYVESSFRYRVNVYAQQGALSAAIRVIYENIRTLNELGLPSVLSSFTKEPRGLVLLTGPTGSGKSTTLAAMIDEINHTRPCHILTIEDPVEYLYHEDKALIHQREIGHDVDSFATALRSAMREDPDVVLVGEMRDFETIQATITLAETGHLVFSTLHTIGAAKTIDRIIDVFPNHQQAQVRVQLAGVLKAVVTQTLLPRVDTNGRVAATEIMIVNEAISNLIRENKGHQINSMIQTGAKVGMETLNASLAKLIRAGKISRESAFAITDNPNELRELFY